jgi:hypothetical protein
MKTNQNYTPEQQQTALNLVRELEPILNSKLFCDYMGYRILLDEEDESYDLYLVTDEDESDPDPIIEGTENLIAIFLYIITNPLKC